MQPRGKLPWILMTLLVTTIALHVRLSRGQGLTSCPGQPVDVAFVLDATDVMLQSSGDFYGRNWELMIDFVRVFIREWNFIGPDGANFAVVTYSATTRVQIELDDYIDIDLLLAAVDDIPLASGGEANLAPALDLVNDGVFNGRGGDRPNAQNIAILIIGQDPDDLTLAIDSARELQDNDVVVNVIAATMDASEAMAIRMLSDAVINSNYWLLLSAASLGSVMTSLSGRVFQQMRCSLVGDEAELICPLDVAILLDSSGSIRQANPDDQSYDNWQIIKDFTLDVVDFLLSTQGRGARVAIIRYSLYVYLEVNLTSYDSLTTDLQNQILNLEYADSWTNTPGALNAAMNYVFTREGGERDDVRDALLIITDGRPEIDGRDVIDETIEAASELKNRGVSISSIGITTRASTDPISRRVLREMSSPPQRMNENYWEARDFRSLANSLGDLSRGWCAPDPGDPCSVDLVFVLDYSGSIGASRFNAVRNFVASFVNGLDPEVTTGVGLVTFSDNQRLGFQLNEHRDLVDLNNAVSSIEYLGGKTNPGSAIEYMRNTMFTSGNGDRSNIPNVAIVITDGMSNKPDKATVIGEARQAKKQGIHIITLGIGPSADVYELNAIASYPASSNVFMVSDVRDLPQVENSLRDFACNKVNECDDADCNGGDCSDGIGMYWCDCPSGTAGINCEKTCREPHDVAFAFDVSGSVGEENAQKEVDFLADVIYRGLNLQDYSRLAVEDFADNANIRFYLDDYNSNRQALDGLDFYYDEGSTNTAEALDNMRTDIFTSGRGDRSNRPNIAVVMTDGQSNDPSATWGSARQLRDDGTHVIAIGVGSNVRQNELEAIASDPSLSNIFTVDDFDNLTSSSNALIDLICNNEDGCAGDPCENGGTCTDLIGGYRCSCRDVFTGAICERECSGAIELVFIFDASSGIRRDRFGKVVEFASSIVNNLEISADETRVAAVIYAENADVEFQLATYNNRQDVIAHFKTLMYRRGKSNTAAALRAMMDDVLTGGATRDDAQKVCLIISNDKSNEDEELTLPYATEAKNQGIHIISVGVGEDVRLLEMRGLASRPRSENVFHAPSWRDLKGLVDDVISATCDDEDGCDNDPCQNGDCEDGFGTYICDCDDDFTGQNC